MTYTFKRHLELKSILTKEILKEKYLVKKLSTVQIAKELKVSKRNVLSYMERYQIKIRTAGEAQRGKILSFSHKEKIKKSLRKDILANPGSLRTSLILRGEMKFCNRCGYTKHPEILVGHHKDRNRNNNSIVNIEILCPNCHALEHYGKKLNKV